MAKESFLIIEDQKSMRELIKSELQQLTNQPILTCQNMAEAQTILEQNNTIAVCLTCLALPDAPNGEIVDLLQKHHITTVVFTATYREETRQDMFQKKVADYIVKSGISSIQYAVQVVHQLYRNTERTIWVHNYDSTQSSKIIGMLRIHRFQTKLFDRCTHMVGKLAMNEIPSLLILDNPHDSEENELFDFTNAVRNQYSQTRLPIMVCENSENITYALKLMKHGVNDFFNTSFTPEEFYIRVNQNIHQAETFKAIQALSQTDALTQISNRRHFYCEAQKQFNTLKAQGKYYFALMADIDHFKNVNDTYGHEKGDDAIIFTANALKKSFENFNFGRIGGEEFCVFGEVEDTSEIEELAEQFRAFIESHAKDDTDVHFTISQGISFSGDSLKDTIGKADKALYDAKESGRNKVCIEY